MANEPTVNPRGLFDRSTLGQPFPAVSVTIERGRIIFFCEVLGECDPLHVDLAAARAAGHPDLVAPPSFFMAIEADAIGELKRRGQPTPMERIGCDFRYLLHGDEAYAYRGQVYAGDTLSVRMRVTDFYDKKGGAMEFATLAFDVEHPERGVVISATRTLLHRLPALEGAQ
uniref:FAS1-like dehydratase domain-containing protein n=1 Tax=Caulobacter sp. (strain K31) TaxID=366602 RepID=B0T6G8_CAUSK